MQCAKITGLTNGLRRGIGKRLLDVESVNNPLRNVIRGMASKANDCKSAEETDKQGITCRRPDLRKRQIPPYKYGFCREPDPRMQMSCPPKGKNRPKGPCCQDDESKGKRPGCKK